MQRGDKPVVFARSARHHRIGKTHARAGISNAGPPAFIPPGPRHGAQWVWRGVDDRGWSWKSWPSRSPTACS